MSLFRKKVIKLVLLFSLLIVLVYGAGRLYYRVTDGFLVSNISSDFAYDERWVGHELNGDEFTGVEESLSQPFFYLGKGCQSYVFGSADGKYVLKFFKYQRFRPQSWLKYFSFIPFVNDYLAQKIQYKTTKREGVFQSWKLAFDHLQPETGVIFVHLNKTNSLNKQLTIYDKVGFTHVLNLDDYEFMVQKRANMLCREINTLMASKKASEAQNLLQRLITMILSEYERGYADNDHALMQNTGVYAGDPIHIDVGQFAFDESVKDPHFYMQELFTKTYKFRIWLKANHPSLADDFDEDLVRIIGKDFYTMQPLWRKKMEIFER